MITLERNRMTFRFPEVHPNARCRLEFQRTLRIPDDDRAYPLPAGLGRFPLRHLDDFADRLPRETRHRGGVVMPIYEKFFEDVIVAREDPGVYYQSTPPAHDMGLAPGGRMRQDIYDDDYGLDAWDEGHASRCFVTIANSVQWLAITGERPPTTPPTARKYTDAGLPWFDYYDGDRKAISGSESLAGLKSVARTGVEKGESPLPENDPLDVAEVVRLTPAGERAVREYPAAGNDRGGTLRHDTRGEPT